MTKAPPVTVVAGALSLRRASALSLSRTRLLPGVSSRLWPDTYLPFAPPGFCLGDVRDRVSSFG